MSQDGITAKDTTLRIGDDSYKAAIARARGYSDRFWEFADTKLLEAADQLESALEEYKQTYSAPVLRRMHHNVNDLSFLLRCIRNKADVCDLLDEIVLDAKGVESETPDL